MKIIFEKSPNKPRTLADLEPYVAAEEHFLDGEPNGYIVWRDDEDNAISLSIGEGKIFVNSGRQPSEILIGRVLGKPRIEL